MGRADRDLMALLLDMQTTEDARAEIRCVCPLPSGRRRDCSKR